MLQDVGRQHPDSHMKTYVEHIAWQVEDPDAVAEWYGEHFGFTVRRRLNNAARALFLADASGHVVLEIYNNPAAPVPRYSDQSPLLLHLAFAVTDPVAVRDALLQAGASIAEELVVTPAGDQLVMMRDPWGFAIQLVCRKEAL